MGSFLPPFIVSIASWSLMRNKSKLIYAYLDIQFSLLKLIIQTDVHFALGLLFLIFVKYGAFIIERQTKQMMNVLFDHINSLPGEAALQ